MHLLSRTNHDLALKFLEITDALSELREAIAMVDGEIVALDPKGRSSFQLLQAYVYSLRAKDSPTVSTPLMWSEVTAALKAKGKAASKNKALVFEADDVLKRVKKWGDLFAPVLTLKQKLPA